MMEALVQWLSGTVVVEVCGKFPERFFNLCRGRGIRLCKIYEVEHCCFLTMRLKDYWTVRPIARKSHCIPKIRRRSGFPFVLKRAKNRKGFLVGLCLACLLAWQCSERIWDIGVSGGFSHTEEQMLCYIASYGIRAGMRSEQIDCFDLEKQIRLHFPDIGWVSAEIKGSRLRIQIKESVMPKQQEKREGYWHIVAARDGIVKQISVTAGVPVVKKGEAVKKGDLLISGILPVIGDHELLLRNQPLAADGVVLLETELSYTKEHGRRYVERTVTGRKSGMSFQAFGVKLFSYIPRYSGENYGIMYYDILPFSFEEFLLPLKIRRYQAYQFRETGKCYTEQEIKAIAETAWGQYLAGLDRQGVEVLECRAVYQVGAHSCTVSGTVLAEGNFIDFREIADEEWRLTDGNNGDNP